MRNQPRTLGHFEHLEDRRMLAVTWNVRIDDYGGAHAAFYDSIRSTLLAAAQEWGRYFSKSKASIQLAVRFDDLEDDTIAYASSESSAFYRQSGKMEIWEMSVPYEIRTGKDVNGKKVDGVITIDSEWLANDYWFDPTPANRYDEEVPSNKLDAYSILQHEVGHILGFDGWRDWTTGVAPGNDYSRFDPFVRMEGGTPYFTGTHARAANGGKSIPLTYTNLYHVGNDTFGDGTGSGHPGSELLSDVMNGVATNWATREWISAIDIAILKDIGLPIVEPPNAPPVLGNLEDQIVAEDGTLRVPFSVSDAESAAETLTVSATSNNPGLFAADGLRIEGSGANRTLVLKPAENRNGAVKVTVSVSDGARLTSDSFLLTVRSVYDPPVLSIAPGITFDEDAAGELPFSVVAGDQPVANLSITATTPYSKVFPAGSLRVISGKNGWSLGLTPAAGQNTGQGWADILLSVNDGISTVSQKVMVIVRPVNDPPTISGIPNQVLLPGTQRELTFFAEDDTVAASDLDYYVGSNNQTLIPPETVRITSHDSERHLTLTPAAGERGSATITLYFDDGDKLSERSFLVRVSDTPYPWQNAANPYDVNHDGFVSPLDALAVINKLTETGGGSLEWPETDDPQALSVDVNPDNQLTPLDALAVINYLNDAARLKAEE